MLKWKGKLILLMLAGCLVMPGCQKKAVQSEEEVSETPKVEINTDKEDDETEVEEEEQKTTTNIYYIDYESGDTLEEEVEFGTLDADALWAKLQEKGIVPEESSVLGFVQNGDVLELDVDSDFGDHIRQQGSTGEHEIMKCVVNTYLDGFSAQKIKITEEGMEFASSHFIYDDYFERME